MGGESYQIQDYIPAQDMVGLNIFGLYSLVSKLAALGKEPNQMKVMQLITDHLADFCSIVERLVITPKLVKPKFALIMGFIKNKTLMGAFMETFTGLDTIVESTDSPAKKD